MSQIKVFSRYAQELEREQRGEMINDHAIASQGTSKNIQKVVQKLTNG
ncbi:MAG: hypothetical protein AAF298_00325 [Cyanobacteria bacterium P01_A01_bin.40]